MTLRHARTPVTAACSAVLLALGAASFAVAANPANGTVSKASPQISWTGSVTNSYFTRIAVVTSDDDSVPCAAPTCDAFKLTVADKDDLTLSGGVPEGTGTGASQVTIRVRKPDGSTTTFSGEATADKPFSTKIKGVATGDYDVEYWNNFVGPPVEYTGTALLGAAKPATAPPAPAAPAAPAPKQDLTVTAKAGKVSAKKASKAKKVAATVTVSRAVKSVTATLRKGSATVAKGSLGAFSGSKKLTLKVSKKLKAGSYSLVLSADDGAGVKATKTIKVKVGK